MNDKFFQLPVWKQERIINAGYQVFADNSYYEKDPAVCQEIQESYRKHMDFKANRALYKLNPEKFVPGLDLEMMYREMYWAAEGYLWEMLQRGELDIEQVEKDFIRMIDFWKSIYLRKEKFSELV